MLAWVVIERTYPRQFLPKSSSLRTLCLCVEFSDSLRPTSVVPTTYALPLATAAPQPLCNQSVTHSFYLDGGCICPPVALPSRQRSSRMPIPCSLSPLFSISCALFCTFLNPQKLNSFIFKRFRTLRQKTQSPGWGKGYVSYPQVRAVFLEIQRGQRGQLSLGATARQSRVTVTNHILSEPFHLHAVTGVLESEWKPMTPDKSPKTLYQKIWDSHIVREDP